MWTIKLLQIKVTAVCFCSNNKRFDGRWESGSRGKNKMSLKWSGSLLERTRNQIEKNKLSIVIEKLKSKKNTEKIRVGLELWAMAWEPVFKRMGTGFIHEGGFKCPSVHFLYNNSAWALRHEEHIFLTKVWYLSKQICRVRVYLKRSGRQI